MEDSNKNEELKKSIENLLMLDSAVFEHYSGFINEVIDNTKSELALLLEEKEVPDAYLFIVKKVVLKRFNRRKNEGMISTTIAEKRVDYQEDDFAEYRQLIRDYIDKKNNPNVGVVTFL